MTDKWQPIETAPRDGSKILVFDGYDFWVVWWSGRRSMFYAHDAADDYFSVYFNEYDLTHWMPLPEPPKKAGK